MILNRGAAAFLALQRLFRQRLTSTARSLVSQQTAQGGHTPIGSDSDSLTPILGTIQQAGTLANTNSEVGSEILPLSQNKSKKRTPPNTTYSCQFGHCTTAVDRLLVYDYAVVVRVLISQATDGH